MSTEISLSLCALAVLSIVLTAAIQTHAGPASGKTETGSSTQPAKVLVRAKFVPNRSMRYNLKLSGSSAWSPAEKGLDWSKMETDFTFDLATKVLRDSGACTFHLVGQKLKSSGSGPKGRVGIQADRRKVRLKVGGAWKAQSDKSPLAKPMTLTQGPLGGVRFTTGTLPIALYVVPRVDRRFWALLTAAPLGKVAVGDEWSERFSVGLPGAQGKPLELNGKWKVLGYRRYGGRKVLTFALAVKMDLKNSKVMLRNGDMAYVHTGKYLAEGLAMWDVQRGVLSFASANQKIAIQAEKSKTRAFRSEHKCTLELKSFKEGAK